MHVLLNAAKLLWPPWNFLSAQLPANIAHLPSKGLLREETRSTFIKIGNFKLNNKSSGEAMLSRQSWVSANLNECLRAFPSQGTWAYTLFRSAHFLYSYVDMRGCIGWDLWRLYKLVHRGWRGSSKNQFLCKVEGQFNSTSFVTLIWDHRCYHLLLNRHLQPIM